MAFDLNPCPFCGAVQNDETPFEAVAGGWTVSCQNIECCASGPARATQIDAAYAWNRREDAPAIVQEMAEQFHVNYERLAPAYGYETRDRTAVPWKDVPADNRGLMMATCAEVLAWLLRRKLG